MTGLYWQAGFFALVVAICAPFDAAMAAASAAVTVSAVATQCSRHNGHNGPVRVPEGFCVIVVADSVGRARHLAVNRNGDVYVALKKANKGGGIAALRDTSGDGRADVIRYFGDYTGTGIRIHNGYLYFASNGAVLRYRLQEGALVPAAEPEFVVRGLPAQPEHAAKSFAFDDAGWLYVNIGAPSNACQKQDRTPRSPGLRPCPQLERRAGIWRFAADTLNQTMSDGERVATGLRHALAIDWNPLDGELYVVQHGRDQLDMLWPERFTAEQNAALPAEEFFRVHEDDNFGWPYCYYDPRQDRKVLAPEYSGDGRKTGRCASHTQPILAFPAHWAPEALLFYTGQQFPRRYRGGAFVAFHGSDDRAPLPQAGYKVVFVPFHNGQPVGTYQDFADGFKGSKILKSPRDARYRAVGLAQGPDGSLYIADSEQGRIWRVLYIGER